MDYITPFEAISIEPSAHRWAPRTHGFAADRGRVRHVRWPSCRPCHSWYSTMSPLAEMALRKCRKTGQGSVGLPWPATTTCRAGLGTNDPAAGWRSGMRTSM